MLRRWTMVGTSSDFMVGRTVRSARQGMSALALWRIGASSASRSLRGNARTLDFESRRDRERDDVSRGINEPPVPWVPFGRPAATRTTRSARGSVARFAGRGAVRSEMASVAGWCRWIVQAGREDNSQENFASGRKTAKRRRRSQARAGPFGRYPGRRVTWFHERPSTSARPLRLEVPAAPRLRMKERAGAGRTVGPARSAPLTRELTIPRGDGAGAPHALSRSACAS